MWQTLSCRYKQFNDRFLCFLEIIWCFRVASWSHGRVKAGLWSSMSETETTKSHSTKCYISQRRGVLNHSTISFEMRSTFFIFVPKPFMTLQAWKFNSIWQVNRRMCRRALQKRTCRSSSLQANVTVDVLCKGDFYGRTSFLNRRIYGCLVCRDGTVFALPPTHICDTMR